MVHYSSQFKKPAFLARFAALEFFSIFFFLLFYSIIFYFSQLPIPLTTTSKHLCQLSEQILVYYSASGNTNTSRTHADEFSGNNFY